MLDLQRSYDRVAGDYAERFLHELESKPLDRALLDRFAQAIQRRGPVCDLGCGPGHIARYLSDRGVDAFGLDLSPRMVELARAAHPGISFRQGDMTALDVEDRAWAGIAAFYSLIHVPPERHVAVLRELRRVLQPGGLLLFSFHVGEELLHVDELWGHAVAMDFYFFSVSAVESSVSRAVFEDIEIIERPPYPEVEYQSNRAYVFARRP
jgi:SAM-dependent methyltransferase